MKRAPIVECLASKIEQVLGNMGLELVDLEFKREPGGQVLRVFIDRPGGVDLDTCSEVSEAIGRRLDEVDLIEAHYNLEVSSPGVDRPLTKPKDFKRFIGSKVSVRKIEPAADGRRRFTGILISADETGFEIKVDNQTLSFKYDEVRKARLVFEF